MTGLCVLLSGQQVTSLSVTVTEDRSRISNNFNFFAMFPLTYRKPLSTALITTASTAIIVLKAEKYQGRKDHLPITEIQFELGWIRVTFALKYNSSMSYFFLNHLSLNHWVSYCKTVGWLLTYLFIRENLRCWNFWGTEEIQQCKVLVWVGGKGRNAWIYVLTSKPDPAIPPKYQTSSVMYSFFSTTLPPGKNNKMLASVHSTASGIRVAPRHLAQSPVHMVF